MPIEKSQAIINYYDNFQSLEIPDLLNIQRNSFQSFVKRGLVEALKKKNPLTLSTLHYEITIFFFPELIQFRRPEFSPKQALSLGKTYGSSIYIPVLIKTNRSKKEQIEWILFGYLPLLTKQGHFIINGIPRVVLHQIIRNPGIYTIPKDSRTKAPTIRIVPEQGSWLNITLDKKNRIWISTRILRRKVSALIFLQALGFSISEISRRIEHSEIFQASFVKPLNFDQKTRHDNILTRAGLKGHPESQEEAWRYLYAHFQEYSSQTREQIVTNQAASEFFWKMIWNPKNRNLGKIGRLQFSEKLGTANSDNETWLTALDMLLATQALIKILFGERIADDIDSLTNKRIRGCGDFLKDELNRGLQEFEYHLKRKIQNTAQADLKDIWRFSRSTLSKSISKTWKSFFTSGTLSQFMDETNPLAQITHKRRVTVLGPGGVSSKQTTIQIRGIHPTYYGRLCPIETPEGQNAGLVNSFTVYTERDSQGNLLTPFFTVYKGQVQRQLKSLYFSPQQENSHILAPADIKTSKWNVLPKTSIPVRKDWKFHYDLWNQINKKSVGILQIISVATSLIPFLEHDDANRALMGSNMQRQAVPLIKPETAIVRTGLETRVVADVNHVLRIAKTGYITSVSANKIRVFQPKKTLQTFSFFTKSTPLVPKRLSQNEVLGRENLGQKLTKQNSSKNQNSLKTRFFNLIFNGSNSKVSLQNFAVAENVSCSTNKNFSTKDHCKKIFWFNKKLLSYQEIPQLSPRFSFSKTFTKPKPGQKKSSRFLQINFNSKTLSKSKQLKTLNLGHEKKSANQNYPLEIYQKTNQSTCILQRPIIKEREWVLKADTLADGSASAQGKLALGKNMLIAYLPWEGYNFEDAILISEKLVSEDIFTSLHIDYYEIEVKNTQYGLETITNQVPIEVDDPTREILRLQRLNSEGLIQIGSWVEEGDYLVGKVSPKSPKGPSVQHQYEKLFNVIMQRENTNLRNTSLRVPKAVEGFVLDVQKLPPKEADVLALAPKNSILRVRVVLLQRRKIQVGDKMAGRHGNKGVISKILPIQDMPYLPDGTPIDIVLNPLGVPSRMNVGQILECLLGLAGYYLNESYTISLFDEKFGAEASRSLVYSKLYQASVTTSNPWLFEPEHPGKITLFDGRTGNCFEQPVTVGCAYMLKLVHLVDDKIHARATGPYSAVTQQPVRGRSRNGGQRLGEMEVWALQAYGAAFTLQELLTVKSDDVDGRKEAVFRIYTNQSFKFGQPESFKVLLRELQALCFNLKLFGQDKKSGRIKSLNLKALEKLGE